MLLFLLKTQETRRGCLLLFPFTFHPKAGEFQGQEITMPQSLFLGV